MFLNVLTLKTRGAMYTWPQHVYMAPGPHFENIIKPQKMTKIRNMMINIVKEHYKAIFLFFTFPFSSLAFE